MDLLLGKVTQQAMNYAIRSGVAMTATYALKQSSKLLQNAPKSNVKDELYELQQRLQHKIQIVSPAIDMIELIAARGNTSLESAVSLTKELRLDIQSLGQRLGKAAAASAEFTTGSSRAKATAQAESEEEMKLIVYDMKKLLTRIEDAVPLISLALTTSGAKLSTQLPSTVSPSRLLQASNLLTSGDAQYLTSTHRAAQIGPTFTLTLYMLFAGNDRPETEEDMRETTWKEVIHKAQVKLRRVPLDVVMSTGSGSDALQSHEISSSKKTPTQEETPSQVRAEARQDEYAYQLMIVEDLDDDRHHDFEDEDTKPGPFDNVKQAGIREMIPIHEVSKIFYADTSKVLNIGMDAESNHPILLLRRDVNAVPPRRMVQQEQLDDADEQEGTHMASGDDGRPKTEEDKQYVGEDHANRKRDPWRLPPSLDPEWIALEVYTEPELSDDEADLNEAEDYEDPREQDFTTPLSEPETSQLSMSLSTLNLHNESTTASEPTPSASTPRPTAQKQFIPQLPTSLSMLELLLRLTSLQQFQQASHLSIPDELLNFFLEESASTGAGGDDHHRQAIRADARRRVGWDPYNESPIKRRGEAYQYQYQNQDYYGSPGVREQYAYNYDEGMSTPGQGTPRQNQQTPQNGSPGMMKGSPRPVQSQTRSITGTPESRSQQGTPSRRPIVGTPGSRHQWLKRQGGEAGRGSPLRAAPVHSDEGIGTSPGSVPDEQK